MDSLKLAALDEKDLEVISACAQDSVMKTGEIQYQAKGKRLVLPLNRFVWEREPRAKGQPAERRRSVLHSGILPISGLNSPSSVPSRSKRWERCLWGLRSMLP